MFDWRNRFDGSHSVRNLVIGLVAVLVAAVALAMIRGLDRQWREYQAARQDLAANMVVDRLLQAGQNLAFERGRANVVLNGAGPISDANRAFLAARRKAADEAMADAFRLLADADSAPQLLALREGWPKIAALRVEVDAAATLPRERRSADLASRWVPAMTGFLKDINNLVAALTLQPENFTRSFRIFSRIKLLAFELREALGLESSIYAASLAGKPLDAAALGEAMRLRGRALATWSNLQRDVSLSGSAGLQTAMNHVEQAFFVAFQPLEDQVTAAALAGRPPPFPTAQYTQASAPALDSIAAFLSAATAETAAYAAANAAQAGRRMALETAGAGLGLLTGLMTLYIVVIRLLRPLGRIQGDLARLSAGDTAIAPPTAGRRDEIGRMQNAVAVFRDSLIQRNAMEDERVRREAELRATLERLNLVLDTAAEGIFGLDGDSRVIFANAAAARMLGWSSPEAMVNGPGHMVLGHVLADGRSCIHGECPIRQTLGDGQVRRCADESFRGAGSRAMPVEYVAAPLLTDGVVSGAVVVFHDIAKRKRLEEELRRSNAELEQFAYVASHDLRQPLRTVISYLALARQGLGPQLDAETTEFLDFASAGAKRMDALIVGLLEYSRIGRAERPFAPVSLDEIARITLLDLDAAIREAGAEVTLADNLPTVRGDHAELTRLLQNLIGNAVKYRAADRPPRIAIGWRDDGDCWTLWVRDNGIGIDSAHHERAFGVFQRLVGREQYEGAGIGLAVCRKIVDHHHGRIWIESTPGEGSCFFVALPKDNADNADVSLPPASSP